MSILRTFSILPVILLVYSGFSYATTPKDLAAKGCQDLLNRKTTPSTYVFWENSSKLRDPETAKRAVVQFYLNFFEENKVGADKVSSACRQEISNLEALNKKSWSKIFVGSSTAECLKVLKESCNAGEFEKLLGAWERAGTKTN